MAEIVALLQYEMQTSNSSHNKAGYTRIGGALHLNTVEDPKGRLGL